MRRSRSKQHIDVDPAACAASAIREYRRAPGAASDDAFQQRFRQLPGDAAPPRRAREPRRRAPLPPHPERDLLWFIAAVRAGARGLGARHLPRRARGVVLLLSGVRAARS